MLDPPLPDRMDPDFERERPTFIPPIKLLRFALTDDGVVWPLLRELPGAVPPCWPPPRSDSFLLLGLLPSVGDATDAGVALLPLG